MCANMKKITIAIIVIALCACTAGKTKQETVIESTAEAKPQEDLALVEYQAKLKIPFAELSQEEEAIGVLYDNELEGGWQLLGMDNKLIQFGSSKAFLFINYYKRFDYSPNKGEYKLPNYDDYTCFVVLYYWNPKTKTWTAEYNGGQQHGAVIHVAPLEGEFSKGDPYDIIHIIEPDGRRYIEIKNHTVLKLDGRRFIKTLP